MKKLLLTSLLSIATVAAFGQGTIQFGNNFGAATWQAPEYNVQSNSTAQLYGNGTFAAPASAVGTTVYTGSPLSGTGWDIALYAGPTTATSYTGMTLLTLETAFGTKTAIPWAMNTLTLAVPGIGGAGSGLPGAGSDANYQVFIWSYTGANTADTTAGQALADEAAGKISLGQSPIETIGGSIGLGFGTTLAPDTEFSSFNQTEITPEPATLAIAGLGAAGLLLFRRKK